MSVRRPLRPRARGVQRRRSAAHRRVEPRGPLRALERARAQRRARMSAVTEGVVEGSRTGNEVLRTEGLTKHFPLKRTARHAGDGPEVRAVDGVDLSIAAG